jgi:hypothetical protein
MKEEVKIVKRECDVCYVVEGKKGWESYYIGRKEKRKRREWIGVWVEKEKIRKGDKDRNMGWEGGCVANSIWE